MRKEIGQEEAFQRRTDHWLPGEAEAGLPIKELCRRHGFSEASYCLWRSKLGGMSMPDAKRLKELEAETVGLKKLLAELLLQMKATREALRKIW